MAASSLASALVLLNALVSILIVNSAGLFVDEDFVGFGYCDEFIVGARVSSVTSH